MKSKRDEWNQRYASRELVWGAEPNAFVPESLTPTISALKFPYPMAKVTLAAIVSPRLKAVNRC